MQRMLAINHAIARFGLWSGGAIILLAALLIGCDILLRRLINYSIGGADELAHFALAIGTAWSLAGAMIDRAHIRVDSAYDHFPKRLKIALDFVGLGLLLGFFAVVTFHAFGVVEQSWLNDTISQSDLQIPMIVPQALWFIGLIAFLIIGTTTFCAAAVLTIAGRFDAVSRMIGTKSVVEETEEELALAKSVETGGPAS